MEMSKELSKPESEKVEMVKMNPAAEGFDTKRPWLNKEKHGSVIPKKRKLVKKRDMEMSKELSKPESEKVEMVKMNPAAEGFDTKRPWLNKEKPGSVIPKKRKLVKKMVFERLAQFFSSSVASCCINKGEATPIQPHML